MSLVGLTFGPVTSYNAPQSKALLEALVKEGKAHIQEVTGC